MECETYCRYCSCEGKIVISAYRHRVNELAKATSEYGSVWRNNSDDALHRCLEVQHPWRLVPSCKS